MRTFILYINTIVLLACFLFGCSHRSTNLLLNQADSLLETYPDSVLAMLDRMPALEEMPEADRSLYALLWAQALDKTEQPLLPCDSLLNFALDYYDEEDLEKAVALMYKGRLLAEMDDEKAAIELNLKALDILKSYPKDTKYKRLIYSVLGLWYGNNGLYDKALEVLNSSLSYSFNAKDTAIAYNNIEYVYAMRNMQDSAIVYQRKAVEYAARSKDTAIMVTSWHNLSMCYGQFRMVDSAVVYARKVVQHVSDSHEMAKSYYYNMGNLYVDLEQYDSANYYLQKSLFISRAQLMPYWSFAVMKADLGDFRSAYHYLDTFVMIQDSLDASAELTGIQHLVYKHQTESRVKDEQYKSQKRTHRMILFFVVFCSVFMLIYQYRLNKRDKRSALYKQSLQYTKEKLCMMQQQIEEYEMNLALLREKDSKNLDAIAQKEQQIAQLKQEKLMLRTWLFHQTPIYKQVLTLSNQQNVDKKNRKVMTVTEQIKLKKTVFEIYADYVSSLQSQYPRLTEDDLLLLCLQEAGVPALTIALCFGHANTVALNQRKSRLKVKMSEE